MPATRTRPELGSANLADVSGLFRAYAAALPVDLTAQSFVEELAGLPGAYAPPQGALLLARAQGGTPLGCIALRPLDAGACEVKRLYVKPATRGLGLGRALVEAIIDGAQRIAYRAMKLDTIPEMAAAVALYRSLGFAPIPPYGSYPYPGLICLGKALPPAAE
ncbi:MAG: GNAT family N-acetyltransferase [Hyphomicrobium sp.]